jgi:hypothetical protein
MFLLDYVEEVVLYSAFLSGDIKFITARVNGLTHC